MTHDELLERVSEYISSECDCESCGFINGPYKALRAVVELHKPLWVDCPCEDKNKCPDLACITCFNEYKQRKDYPCETIEAIEKELR